MEFLADAVSAVVVHDRDAVLAHEFFAGDADVVEVSARTNGVDPGPHRLEGEVDEALTCNRGFAHNKHAGGVAVIAVLDARDVDVDDVALLQFLRLRRNAVADDVVDRDAARRGVGRHAGRLIAEARRNALLHVYGVVVK